MKLDIYKKFCAYTISEVIIVISILGIVAALTIPNLAKKYQESKNVSKILKNYTLINNIVD